MLNTKSRVLKFNNVMNHVENCVENHVKNFKMCWKPCWKFQGMLKVTMTWPLRDPFHQFWNIITVIKIKSDSINEDYRSLWGYMSSLIEILCVLQGKLGLFVGNSCMICMLRKFLLFELAVNLFSNQVNLLSIFTSCEKLRAFERNPCFWNSCLMPWRPIIYL